MDYLYSELKKFGKTKANEPLSKHTTYKIGGPARYFVEVLKVEKLVELLRFLEQEGEEYFILGGGSNVLVGDEGFGGVVIKIKTCEIKINEKIVEASAGCSSVEVARKSIEAGLGGFEWGVGIPGTIGGAVRGNAGAMGGDMAKIVKEVEVFQDGEVFVMSNSDCKFDYRESVFKKNNAVILRVFLELKKAENKDGLREALGHLKYRTTTQPQGYASAGCVFKNYKISAEEGKRLKKFNIPEEFLKKGIISAGWLIENSGLQNEAVGGAKISEKHCNFIVVKGETSARDIVNLIEKVKTAVYDKYGIKLQEEIKILI